MADLVIPGLITIPVALFLALWIYRDAKERNMDTADMWAVGFFVGFFFPPIVGGVLVYVFYLQRRRGRGRSPTTVPAQ